MFNGGRGTVERRTTREDSTEELKHYEPDSRDRRWFVMLDRASLIAWRS